MTCFILLEITRQASMTTSFMIRLVLKIDGIHCLCSSPNVDLPNWLMYSSKTGCLGSVKLLIFSNPTLSAEEKMQDFQKSLFIYTVIVLKQDQAQCFQIFNKKSVFKSEPNYDHTLPNGTLRKCWFTVHFIIYYD